MAKEEVNKKLDEPTSGKPKKNKGRLVVGGVIGGVMLVEALVMVVLVRSFGGGAPQEAQAVGPGGLDTSAGQKASEKVEVEIVSLRATNEKAQRPVIYQLSIFAVVPSEYEEEFRQVLERRRETIKDRFTRIVRAADPNCFSEPDLATVRGQFKHELVQIIGIEEAVDEVLIPSVVPFSDY